jgi:hypothetical protein
MHVIEHDRTIIKALNLDPAELALVCARFQDEGIPLSAPFFLSLNEEAVHNDSRGIHWRVDTKTLAEKLSAVGPEARRALNRAIFRFWEQYPAARPADAMFTAGLI